MVFKIWLYVIGSIGLIGGLYSLIKNKQKIGGWISFFSILIFVGGSLNIGDLISFNNSFNVEKEIKEIRKDVGDLKLQVSQTIELKQDISQTINLITKVEKEIVNIKESISYFYSQMNTDIYVDEDVDKKYFVVDYGYKRGIFFELGGIPIENTIFFSDDSQVIYSVPVYVVVNNILFLTTNTSKEHLFDGEGKDVIRISYFQDSSSNEEIFDLGKNDFIWDIKLPPHDHKDTIKQILETVLNKSNLDKLKVE